MTGKTIADYTGSVYWCDWQLTAIGDF